MDAPELFFNCFVVAAFTSSAVDHWFIGRGVILVPLRAFLLGCFVYTESYLAYHAQPAMWLYVALNVWGLVNLYVRRMSPLRSGDAARADKPSTKGFVPGSQSGGDDD